MSFLSNRLEFKWGWQGSFFWKSAKAKIGANISRRHHIGRTDAADEGSEIPMPGKIFPKYTNKRRQYLEITGNGQGRKNGENISRRHHIGRTDAADKGSEIPIPGKNFFQ